MQGSIRTRLLAIFVFLSILVFGLAVYGVVKINRVAESARLVLAERIPLSRCSAEARLAVARGAAYVDKVLYVQDYDRIDQIQMFAGQFRRTTVDFNMYIRAIIWGSESEAFRKSSGGLIYTEWQNRKLDESLKVFKAPKHIQQTAGKAHIYYGAFSNYVREIIRAQRKILRMELAGQFNEALDEAKKIEGYIEKADRFKALTDEALSKVILDVTRHVDASGAFITRAQRLSVIGLTIFAFIIFALALSIGGIFTRALTRPIIKLRDAAMDIGKGRWGTRINIRSHDEIGDLAASFNQMTASLKQQRAQLVKKDFVDNILNSAGEGIYGLNTEGLTTFVNPAAARMIGWKQKELIGKFQHNILHHSHRDGTPYSHEVCPIYAAFRDGKVHHTDEEVFWRKDGTSFPVEYTSTPIWEKGKISGAVVTFMDITERQHAEEALQKAYAELKSNQDQLMQAEKLQSVGRLAAGVAHEVKNPLAILMQGLEFLSKKMRSAEEEEVREVYSDLVQAVKRADSVIRGLVDFAAPHELRIKAQGIDAVLERSLSLVKHELDRNGIEVVKSFAKSLPPVRIDQNKIQHVFINLFTNAAYAMKKGGTLTVRTFLKTLTGQEPYLSNQVKGVFKSGDTAVIVQIDDTGPGIPTEQIAKVLDPFFTTKPTGQGTGLGLSVTHSIVKMHEGALHMQNHEKGGLRVEIVFKV